MNESEKNLDSVLRVVEGYDFFMKETLLNELMKEHNEKVPLHESEKL